MYTEDQLLPLSALPQLVYCERRAALILIEQVWDDNRFTAEGRLLHERVHSQEGESRGDVRIARGLALRSLSLGLSGKADVVEFHRTPEASNPTPHAPSAPAPEHPQPNTEHHLWVPFPVEYKRGKPKPDNSDLVQLCAQAICLEEMLGVPVPEGALFYGIPHRRLNVAFTPELRHETRQAAERLHALVASRRVPKAEFGPRCDNCSLVELCLPRVTSGRSAARYLERVFEEADE